MLPFIIVKLIHSMHIKLHEFGKHECCTDKVYSSPRSEFNSMNVARIQYKRGLYFTVERTLHCVWADYGFDFIWWPYFNLSPFIGLCYVHRMQWWIYFCVMPNSNNIVFIEWLCACLDWDLFFINLKLINEWMNEWELRCSCWKG